MHVLTVCYGHPADPAAFDSYYTSTHAPLAEKIPGMTSYTYRHCASLDGSQPPYYLLAELSFPSQEAMGAALSSAEAQARPPTSRTSPPAASPCSSPTTDPRWPAAPTSGGWSKAEALPAVPTGRGSIVSAFAGLQP